MPNIFTFQIKSEIKEYRERIIGQTRAEIQDFKI
jgi:hypothetical protein